MRKICLCKKSYIIIQSPFSWKKIRAPGSIFPSKGLHNQIKYRNKPQYTQQSNSCLSYCISKTSFYIIHCFYLFKRLFHSEIAHWKFPSPFMLDDLLYTIKEKTAEIINTKIPITAANL